MKIDIRSIPSTEARKRKTGCDYKEVNGSVLIEIVEMKNWKFEALLIIHALTEYFFVKSFGISVKDIEAFDKKFEEDRDTGIHDIHDEPGDALDSPYHVPHTLATGIERIAAGFLRVHWHEFAYCIDNLVLARLTRHTQTGKRR